MQIRKSFIVFVLIFLLFPYISIAQDSESSSYKVQMGNFNFTAGEKSSTSYTLTDTAGELSPGQSSSGSYTIKAGFQYVNTIVPFTFSLSNSIINFGTLSPQTPQTDTTNITVTSGAAFGYQVTSQENHQLESVGYPGTVFIDDVVGDNADITHTNQGDWLLSTTYGMGYTLSNITGTDAVFTSGYRSFADESCVESPVVVMSRNGVTSTSEVQVGYKVNISNVQESGQYQNVVTYVATGTF